MVVRPERQSDYNYIPRSCPIVIDNGASTFRIGWAGESDPRITFRNVVLRPRHKGTGETVTIVGDHDPALLKYFDCSRASHRSPFDSNVVYQFEIMEYILDYGFERMGADGSKVDHPILITECACNPVQSRSKMAELLFENYGVPSVAFGVDAAFSYKYNQGLGICDKDGLAVSSGFTTGHVIPFVSGEPLFEACCRTNIGGYHVTDYLKQLLTLKHPNHMSNLLWEKVEDLKREHCYVAKDYASELQLLQKGTKEAEEKTRCWQLPWVPPPTEEPPSGEEIARKAAIREKQGQRLREMAAAKKSSRISDLENELRGLEFLLNELKTVKGNDIQEFLSQTGYISKQEIESAIIQVTQSLRKAKGEPIENEDKTESPATDKYSLINIPDERLSPEQLKEKRRQVFLKTTAEGKQRARQKRVEEELERERKNQLDEEKRLENPDLYLERLRAKHKELTEKVEQRKRLKTNGNQNVSTNVGRGERLNAVQKERMRLLTTAAFDRGKGEDTFGTKEEDWQLYKLMSKDNDEDDDGPDYDEAELIRVTSRLQDIDPTFAPKIEGYQTVSLRSLTKEDFQIKLGVERFRCPEILFQPNMVGIDQAGLDEMAGVSIRRLGETGNAEVEERMTNSVLLTGGSCLFPGMVERMEAGIRMLRPYESPIRVVRAADPIVDAWRGAAVFAASERFVVQTFSRRDWDEYGEHGLRKFRLRYNI
ncbi:Actin-related protein 5 [Ranunculus cassubicifolius]